MFVWIELFYRIPIEEAILIDLFGQEYCEYRTKVGALGPFWFFHCLNTPQVLNSNGLEHVDDVSAKHYVKIEDN